MKYSEIVKKLKLKVNKKNDGDKLAYVTHYLQTYNTPVNKYYEAEAVKHIPKDFNPQTIEWDVPFPPAENYQFTFIDLFAGIGGLRIAFQELGGKCVFSSEIDVYAKQTYQENFGEVPFGDITKINEKMIPEHDFLLAGFPCQAFSIAGKRGGFEDTRGTLFFDIARIIKEKRPKAFFLENVKGLMNHDRGRTIKVILNTLREDLDYFVPDPEIVNAKDFGVPQNRERVFIVGFRKDLGITEFQYPEPIPSNVTVKDIKEEKPVSAKYYLSTTLLESLREHRLRHSAKGNGFGYTVIDDDDIANAIVTGGMGRERNLIVDKRLKDFTPVTNIKGEVNREGIRRMTPREWARLQGFPDSFKISVSDTQAYKQFGNSVAIPAVKATGEQVIKRVIKDYNVKEVNIDEGEMRKMKMNKGEWSEIYTLVKLLSDGKLYAADSDLNKLESIYYPILKILRSELIDDNCVDYEYSYDSDTILESISNETIIRIVNGTNNELLLEITVQEFRDKSIQLLNEIKQGKGSFEVSEEIMNFLNSIYITKKSTDSTNKKRDITIVVYDRFTGFRPELGFSIKSKLGRPATLLNASQSTNFIYKVTSDGEIISDDVIEEINNKYSSIYEILINLYKRGFRLEFVKVANDVFNSNLQMIDSNFPSILAFVLESFYSKKCNSTSLIDYVKLLDEENPCGFNMNNNHPIYEYKIKQFLNDVALGMKPTEIWQGDYEDATGGYIVVKEDGEIVCYHIYNVNEFHEYLLKNTKLEQASRKRHDFGTLYKEGNDVYIKLNLQIRFQ